MEKTYLIASLIKRGCVISFVLDDYETGEHYALKPLDPYGNEFAAPTLFTRDESIEFIQQEMKEKGCNAFELYPIPLDAENLKKFYQGCWN